MKKLLLLFLIIAIFASFVTAIDCSMLGQDEN